MFSICCNCTYKVNTYKVNIYKANTYKVNTYNVILWGKTLREILPVICLNYYAYTNERPYKHKFKKSILLKEKHIKHIKHIKIY